MATFCGNPSYSAPELLNKIPFNGKFVDIWNLGIILYRFVVPENYNNDSNVSKIIQMILNADFPIPNNVSESCNELIR
jgi:serine/threonine protein kinase